MVKSKSFLPPSKIFFEFLDRYEHFVSLQWFVENHLKEDFEKLEEAYGYIIKELEGVRGKKDVELVVGWYKEGQETPLDFKEFQNQHYILFVYSQMEQYFFKCFKSVLMIEPDILKENTLTIQKILENNKDFDLILDEKAEEIALKQFRTNFSDIFEKFVREKLGLRHGITEDEIMALNDFKQLRNLFAHGDGTITRSFLKKVQEPSLKLGLGDKLQITKEIKNKAWEIVLQVVMKFDEVLVKTYPELSYKPHSSS